MQHGRTLKFLVSGVKSGRRMLRRFDYLLLFSDSLVLFCDWTSRLHVQAHRQFKKNCGRCGRVILLQDFALPWSWSVAMDACHGEISFACCASILPYPSAASPVFFHLHFGTLRPAARKMIFAHNLWHLVYRCDQASRYRFTLNSRNCVTFLRFAELWALELRIRIIGLCRNHDVG